jgi:hypothetical protein
MYTSYPTAGDVENWLRSSTFWPEDENQVLRAQSQAQIAAVAAVDEWETLTGWRPFLAGAEDEVRAFDATDSTGWLDFEGGAVSVSSVSIATTVLTLGEQYWLTPGNAASQGRPFTGIQFSPRYQTLGWRRPGGISVTARWGYDAELPADVFQACLQRAAINTLRAIPNEQGLASISQEGFSKALDVVGVLTQKDIAQGGDKDFTVLAARYARVVC